MGEIVSRKYTQLSEISKETAIRYLKELSEKYSPGSVIADVPSNRVGANAGIFEENGGGNPSWPNDPRGAGAGGASTREGIEICSRQEYSD